MDNLCHTLAGAALGEAGLKAGTRFGNPVLMIAANLPDIDVLAFASALPAVTFRRGWTHGVLAQGLLPILLTGLVLAVDRRWPARDGAVRARATPLLLLSYAGVLSHVFLDYLNNYGVRLLMPFSGRWFYGDSVFIIDPWLWIVFGAGVFMARGYQRPAPARTALAVAALYIAVMIVSAAAARDIVLETWTRNQGRPPHALMVGPMPVDPFTRQIIVDAGDRYETGKFRWWSRRVDLDDRSVPRGDDHPAVVRAREHPDIRAVLVWTRFPYFEIAPDPEGTRVTLRDMRFGARVGSVTVVVSDSSALLAGQRTLGNVLQGQGALTGLQPGCHHFGGDDLLVPGDPQVWVSHRAQMAAEGPFAPQPDCHSRLVHRHPIHCRGGGIQEITGRATGERPDF